MKPWQHDSAGCNCILSLRKDTLGYCEDAIDLDMILYYAHQLDDFEQAHHDFEAVKDLWTPTLFGKMVGMIDQARCCKLDNAVREFHQAIRNNGLWKCWIEAVQEYPRFKNLMIQELSTVLENLSPKYLKDVKIEHLLLIFGPLEGAGAIIHGKKRKLKRQIQKWIETQPDDVLDVHWTEINILKWRLQQVIDQKDKEQEERSRSKNAYQYNWRQKSAGNSGTSSPQSLTNTDCWPALRKAFENGERNHISIGA